MGWGLYVPPTPYGIDADFNLPPQRDSALWGGTGAVGSGLRTSSTRSAGTPSPENPGCLWDPSANDYACDDGYYLNSGAAIPGSENQGEAPPQSATDALKAAARHGDKNALNQLAKSGNFAAKLAVTIGSSLGTAEAIVIGGAALLAVVATGIATKQ